ncbi:MAG TPA: TVP38/TMEM64 family protein, partial [Syntrophobacteria bacterium]|nr:TVP38/TMEM64 family protein [Syntrophobacteria bacterium]
RERLINFIKSFHPYDEFVFILFQILQVVFAPIPGEVTGLIGGYLYGPVLGTIYSTVGLTVGSWLAFMLARFLGLPFVEKAVNPEILKKYDYVMEHQGAIVSFILFLIPGFPKDYLCYIMGLSHMKLWTFLIISTVGRLIGTMLLSMSGSYVRSNHYVGLLVLLGAGGVFVLLAYLYRERWIDMLRSKERP